ncbi:ATP-binding protein [Leptospira bandrabouensis]|uniref:ATP-dependent nuclease n=1 Tax=Leptospira bandrabouensis TaxID=2484903 RepID=UPI00223CE28A|nr:AAA family ATPase [Leptospira bandrabouensis]MCW7479426.1 ATP-binding protein [Leptospira bandrabouensis]MCW7487109.1 ATP-binding protein [Leptospira bandrabouensis]
MKYISFKIKNFKGIKSVNIDLTRHPQINIFTLVGLNESGKTTILEAMHFFSQNESPNTHEYIPKSKKHNFNESIEITATLAFTDEDKIAFSNYLEKQFKYTLKDDLNIFSVTKEHSFINSIPDQSTIHWNLKFDITTKTEKTKTIDLSNGVENEIKNYLTSQMPVIIYYPNFLFDIPQKIYLDNTLEIGKENLQQSARPQTKEEKSQPFYLQVIQDVLDYMGGDLKIGTHIVERFKKRESSVEAKEALESQILKMSSKMNQVIFSAWKQIFPNSKSKDIELQIGEEEGRSYFEIKIREGSNKFQIRERSLGFRWFFTFLLFTEFRKVRNEDPGETIFLLDEPAYNLHSTAQKILLKVFSALADNCKLIYTTHSHYLIDPTWLSGAYIIKNQALDYENEIDFDESSTDVSVIPYRQFVANYPNQSTYFQPILDALDYQPSKLEIVPKLTIFEGKYDYYCMRYINEIILENKYTLNPYPGNGDDLLRVIKLYLAWGTKFIVILDGDRAGENAKKRYETELGLITADTVFNLRDISNKWTGFATESLFTESEKMRIINSLYPEAKEFTKRNFFTSIEDLLISKKSIKLSKTTTNNFEKIFQFIQKHLN